MAGTDQMDVIIYGVGGHGSAPQYAKDPVVMGSMAVLGYQTLISRTVDPQAPAVITVGAFQAGEVNDVIPGSAPLKPDLRWFDPKVREQMIEGIKRITDGIAAAADVPKDKMPKYILKGRGGRVVNGGEGSRQADAALKRALGQDKVLPGLPPVMGSEDFQNLAAPHPTTKILLVWVGCGPADVLQAMKKGVMPAANHNPKFKVELPDRSGHQGECRRLVGVPEEAVEGAAEPTLHLTGARGLRSVTAPQPRQVSWVVRPSGVDNPAVSQAIDRGWRYTCSFDFRSSVGCSFSVPPPVRMRRSAFPRESTARAN